MAPCQTNTFIFSPVCASEISVGYMSSPYKLFYFDGRGSGEAIRLLFHYAGVPFEDVCFGMEEWREKHKSNFFYGQVPVLVVDGKQLAQSAAILRFLGNKFGLAGKDEWEKAKANEIIEFQKDVNAALGPFVWVKMGYRDGNLEQLCSEVFEPGVQRLFPRYVQLLAQSGSGFLLPSGVSMADFLVADYLYTIKKIEPDAISAHPELDPYVGRVHALPQLKEYLDTRKD